MCDVQPQLPRTKIYRALIAKELRLARLPITALLVTGIFSYLVPLTASLVSGQGMDRWDRLLTSGSSAGIFVTALLGAAFGAMAIAGERSDQTADFIGLLPVTRRQIVVTKWCVSFLALAMSVALHTAAAVAIRYIFDGSHQPGLLTMFARESIESTVQRLGAIVCLFGVAWMIGTVIRSVAISACSSIVLAAAVLVWVDTVGDHHVYFGLPTADQFALLTALLGVSGLVLGTAYYLRRIAP